MKTIKKGKKEYLRMYLRNNEKRNWWGKILKPAKSREIYIRIYNIKEVK